jgi:LPXTG-motif cell wall-anchored protein
MTNMADVPNACWCLASHSGDRSRPRAATLKARMRLRRSVRPCSVLLVAFLATLAPGRPASAAMCARWDPPTAAPTVGSPLILSFRTYALIAKGPDDVTLKPWAVPNYPFGVQALSPGGERSTVPVAPSSSDDRVWVGSFTPDREGEWTLIILNFPGADASCYEDAVIKVEQNQHEQGNQALTFAAIGLVVIGGLAGFALLRRRRSLSS